LPEASLVIRGGTVVGPEGPQRLDVAVRRGAVAGLAESIDPPRGAVVLDAGGCLVGPGLVDLHTHLRQPGREEAETIESGARAAALGGYTAIVAMPNTEPAIDSAGVASEVLSLGAGCAAEVAVAGAITVGRAGTALAPLGELAALGVRLFTDDGAGVQDGALMRRALDYAKGLGVTLAQHCEDACLAAGGAMHEGCWSSRLGIPGMPAAAEEAMVARDITLARLTGPLPAPLDRRFGRPGPPGQGGGAPGDRRGGTAPHAADPCGSGGVRPRLQGEPAAAHRRGRRCRRRRLVRRHH
jgi:dihydroorotase